MKLLVADIGGTNARFAYKDDVSNELSNFSYLKCTDFENIFDAIKYYQEENNLHIKITNYYDFRYDELRRIK